MNEFMNQAITIALHGMHANEGGPFGAVVVKDGVIVGRGHNKVLTAHDPTAHAEVTAIRDACKTLGTHELTGCIIYSSCEPCPMCLAAIYWSRIEKIFFACNRKDAADIGFDDDFLYQEINVELTERKIPVEEMMHEEGLSVFKEWIEKSDKKMY